MHKSTLKRLKREAAIREVAGTMPAWQVAEKFNVSEKNLQGLCSRAGISLAFYHKPYSEEDKAAVLAGREQGQTIAAIAKTIGRTEGSVSAFLCHHKTTAGYEVQE